jgi:hypothetical protein
MRLKIEEICTKTNRFINEQIRNKPCMLPFNKILIRKPLLSLKQFNRRSKIVPTEVL